MSLLLIIEDDEFGIQINEFTEKYNSLFGVDLKGELLTKMALSCFMEDVEEGRIDIIGLADTFGFGDEQLELTPTEEAVNRRLQVINELEGMRNV